jgi:hypothetical protein
MRSTAASRTISFAARATSGAAPRTPASLAARSAALASAAARWITGSTFGEGLRGRQLLHAEAVLGVGVERELVGVELLIALDANKRLCDHAALHAWQSDARFQRGDVRSESVAGGGA